MKPISLADLERRARGKRILVDTNIVIYLTDAIKPYVSLSKRLFQMIENGDATAVVSIVTVAEVMSGPLKKGKQKIAHDVKKYLLNFPNVHCQEINTDVLDQLGRDSRIAWRGLRNIDSLIIASGLVNDVDLIVSNDGHFRKAVTKDLILSFDS